MDWKVFLNQDPRFSGMASRVGRRPAWPTLAAVGTAAVVIVVPVVLVLLAGLVVGVVVYTVASLIAGVGEWFKSLGGGGGDAARQTQSPGDDLRDNVRVVQRP